MEKTIAWNCIHNPIIDREPAIAVRDPTLVIDRDIFYLFYTAVEYHRWQYHFYVDLSTSADLQHWSPPLRVIPTDDGFSSPGNVLRVDNHWILCVQTYPVDRFLQYGNDTCRLWIMEGDTLTHWNPPYLIQPQGCTAPWVKSPRQIDPFLVAFEGQFWCFYKAEGKLGLLVSPDLYLWTDALDTPVLSNKNVPDHTTLENICIIQDKDQFRMFF